VDLKNKSCIIYMKNIYNENPFYFGRMVKVPYFTDREKDIARLQSNFRNGINTILISPRRWGKSSLVQKAGTEMQDENIKVAYIDMFSIRNEVDYLDKNEVMRLEVVCDIACATEVVL
jgi:predicted AAA+ superfamily ATPase